MKTVIISQTNISIPGIAAVENGCYAKYHEYVEDIVIRDLTYRKWCTSFQSGNDTKESP